MTNLGWYPLGLQNQINWLLNRTYLHLDIYAPQGGSIQVGFQYYGHSGTNEAREIYGPAISNLPAGEWYSIDFPLIIYTDQGYNRNSINVLRFKGSAEEIYISNMYTFNGTPQNLYPYHTPDNDAGLKSLTVPEGELMPEFRS
jgi:hypothetical protein